MSVVMTRSRTRAARAPRGAELATLALALLLAAPLVAALGAPAAVGDPPSKPVLLLIHGGGFYEGDPGQMDYAAAIAAEDGRFATVQPAYPLDNLTGAFEHVRAVARSLAARGREVYAYGDSAGGAIAAWLAARGYVEAAAAKAPPTALVGWRSQIAARYATAPPTDPHSWRHMRATPRVRRAFSSAFRASLRPVRIYQSCEDTIVPCSINIRFARRDPEVSLVRIWGPHKDRAAKAYSFRSGLEWLGAKAGAPASR